ncbi:MAG: (Fe-S)-binding protein [Candidatus Thorarchaeota archaeon]
MSVSNRISAFKQEKCNLCGFCFNKCPVLKLSITESQKEIKRLIENGKSKYVLPKCNSCFSCNIYCPQQANPYQLILERWNSLYKTRGAPPIYRFVCPTEVPNIWQLLNIFLSNEEKRLINRWVTQIPKTNEQILLIGNYTHLFPFIFDESRLLNDYTPVSRIDQWEAGAYLYQGGYLDLVKQIAIRCDNDFKQWGVKKVITPLDAVHYMFSEVHPKEMLINHHQQFVNFNDLILEEIKSGKLSLPNKLNLDITIHDNCYSKVLGGAFWEVPREILQKCGCNLKEMKHIKEDSLCCGFGAGASWIKNISIPFDIISEGIKKFNEAMETGADGLVTYCSGCLYLLWATKELLGYNIDLYHIIEIVRMAMGESIPYPNAHKERAWDIIAIITYQLIISIFQNNFFIRKITYDKNFSTFWPKRYQILKILRLTFKISIIRKIYSKLFVILMRLMKTR